VPVVVASAALAYGDPLAANKLTVVQFPANLAPQGAFASVDQLVNAKGPPTMVLAAIAPREPVLPTMVTGPGSRNSVSALIAPGMRAYAVRISDVAGVGGHALPGDRVDVVLTRQPPQRPGSVQASERNLVSDVVVQNVRLLGVNLNVDPASTATAAQADPRTATLEVSLQDAQKLALAGGVGTLSLALRGMGAADTASTRQVLVNDLAAQGERLTPVVRRARPSVARPAETGGKAALVIVQGDRDASVSVPAEKPKGA
jgi:pilus assembly protein CpaB